MNPIGCQSSEANKPKPSKKMSTILLSLPEIYASYKKWISENPIKASDYEVTIKWISYFVAGRINNSHIVSELVYCLSNLLVLFNDRIIRTEKNLELPCSGDTLKIWLTVLEYCEVLLELSSRQVWGSKGKWLVVVSIQVFKCISRLLLISKHKESIIQHPPVPVLMRKQAMVPPVSETAAAEVAQAQLDSVAFNLKRSGKIIRRVDASPPIHVRNWRSIQRTQFDNEQTIEQALAGQQLIAETLYILKPVAHLCALGCFGDKSWKPFLLSLLMDLGSIQLYKKGDKGLTSKQRIEVSRRYVGLLLYLIRSPFYDRHSRDRITAILTSLSKNMPLASIICLPLKKYVPFWQSNYFYMWST